MTVKVHNAAFEEDGDEIVLRGTLDPGSIGQLHFGPYQREKGFSTSHTNEIITGVHKSSSHIPDITVGMRGQKFTDNGKGTVTLHDRCYCIDGGQRIHGAVMAMRENPELKLRLGIKVHFSTTEASEAELFRKINTTQTRVAASVLFRNLKRGNAAVRLLVELDKNDRFALAGRVCWDQGRKYRDLVLGFQMARVIGELHAHKGGAMRSHVVDDLAIALDNLMTDIGEEAFASNVIRFFDTVDRCWGIRALVGGRDESRAHLKTEFLTTVARLFSRYPDFWNDKLRAEFNCMERHAKRLKTFKPANYVVPTKNAQARKDVLYEVLRQHLKLEPLDEAVVSDLQAAE